MKKMFLIISVFISMAFQQVISFDRVWKKGYMDGYCYEVEYCIKPISPIAPVPRLQDSSYKAIYNRGFVDGLKDNPERQDYGK